MNVIEVTDLYGDEWKMTFGAIQIKKRDGMTYVMWFVIDGPLLTQPYRYEMILTPVFVEWWV